MKYIYILWKSIFNLENGKSPQLKEHTRAKISLVCENKMLTVRQNFLLIGMSEANQDLKLIFQLGGWFTVLHHTELELHRKMKNFTLKQVMCRSGFLLL